MLTWITVTGTVEIRRDLQEDLSVDHAFLQHELLLFGLDSAPSKRLPNRVPRRRAFLDPLCKMHVADSVLL